jgi:hypothetical protein
MRRLPAAASKVRAHHAAAEQDAESFLTAAFTGLRLGSSSPCVGGRRFRSAARALSAVPQPVRQRRRPESNRCTRLCRPLRSHSATSPQRPSVPLLALRPRAISSAGRAPPRQGGGHWFEPSIAHSREPRCVGASVVSAASSSDQRGTDRQVSQTKGAPTAPAPGGAAPGPSAELERETPCPTTGSTSR